MITLLIVLGFLIPYFGIGYKAAIWNIPRYEAAYKKEYPSLDPAHKTVFMAMLFFWPIYFIPLALAQGLNNSIEKHSPHLQQKAAIKEQRYQDALASKTVIDEYELGMGNHSQKDLRNARIAILQYKYPEAIRGEVEFDPEFYRTKIVPIWYDHVVGTYDVYTPKEIMR